MEVPGRRTEFDVEENAENIDFRCEPCQSNSTATPANGFCKDCNEFMCNTCFRQHLNLKLCKHHVLVNSDLSSLSFQRSDERKIYCKQHNGETVKFYCRDHGVVGCGDCIIRQHKTCQSEYIQDLSDNFRQNKEYKSLKENIEKVISNRIVLEKEIQDNTKDNKLMLEKALGDIRQFRLDINEYLDKVESDVIAKVETIMRENETLLTKLENDCQTLSTKLEKITALLNSENFKDNALFIHTVECKPMVSESEVAISNMKSKGMKKYEFVPDHQLHSLSTTAKNLGTLEISTVNVCHQTTKRTSDEGQLPTSLSTENMCRSKSSNTHEMCLRGITAKLDARIWNIAKSSSHFSYIKDKLKQIHVTVIDENVPEIKAGTTYQIQCAREILANFDTTEARGVSKEQNSKRGDSYPVYESEILENISFEEWCIAREINKEDINQLEENFCRFEYSEEKKTLTVQVYKGFTARAFVKKLRNCLTDLKSKEIIDIPLGMINEDLKDNIVLCIKEIENTIGHPCFVWLKDQSMLLAFDESYEKLMKLKHQIFSKLGMTKPTARSRGKRAIVDSSSTSMSIPKSDQGSERNNKKQMLLSSCENFEKYTIHGIDVCVYKADILKLKVDCIVNAANTHLSHGGGVAGVIARAAGKMLIEESDRFISKYGQLPVGHVCSTTPGDLPYKCVIHAVGPRWTDYFPHSLKDIQKCENDLYLAIFNCFVEGEKNQVKKIAIPAVSQAILGVPSEICVNQYARATIDYCKKAVGVPTALSEIHFIDTNLKIVEKIQDIFNILVREQKASPYNRNDYVQKSVRSSFHQKGSTEADEMKLLEPLFCEGDWRCMVFYVVPNSKVKIICKNDIFMEKASGIVISVNEEGKGGALFETALNKMLPRCPEIVTSNLKKRLCHGAKIGQVVESDGYACGYPSILFVLYPYSAQSKTHGQRKDELIHVYRNVLMEANKTGKIKSIVTTLFGINSAKDEELILGAEAFLTSYVSFCEQMYKEPWQLDVKIVCQTEHTFDVVCSVFSSYVRTHSKLKEIRDS